MIYGVNFPALGFYFIFSKKKERNIKYQTLKKKRRTKQEQKTI